MPRSGYLELTREQEPCFRAVVPDSRSIRISGAILSKSLATVKYRQEHVSRANTIQSSPDLDKMLLGARVHYHLMVHLKDKFELAGNLADNIFPSNPQIVTMSTLPPDAKAWVDKRVEELVQLAARRKRGGPGVVPPR